jgi:hypothetical protein
MELISWYGWEFLASAPNTNGVTFSQELNLPSGMYSALCVLTISQGTFSGGSNFGAFCGIMSYQANGTLTEPPSSSPPSGAGIPFIFPTANLTQITFGFGVGPASSGQGYIYISGWQ